MKHRTTAQNLHRIRYRQDQRLQATDLQDDMAYEARLRAVHVRAVHKVLGVALGFEVSTNPSENTVKVSPGLAYDCYGREILSSKSQVFSAPALPDSIIAGWFELVIRYRQLASPTLNPKSFCTGSESPKIEQPDWRWVYAGPVVEFDQNPPLLAADVRLGEEIPLARVQVNTAGELTALDFSQRRNAQGLVRPHIATGQQPQGSLAIEGSILSWSVEIDTSEGGFTSHTPLYFVSLADHPFSQTAGFAQVLQTSGTGENSLREDLLRNAIGPWVAIHRPNRTRLRLEVNMAVSVTNTTLLSQVIGLQESPLQLPVTVNWLGIEPMDSCAPDISFRDSFWLYLYDYPIFTPFFSSNVDFLNTVTPTL